MDEVHAMPVAGATPTRPELRPGTRSGGIRWGHLVATLLALALIGAWVGLWKKSMRRDTMAYGQLTWIPALPFLAGDFKVHIDHVARLQAAGLDPYHRPEDWICGLYPYPPMMGRMYFWVKYFDTSTAAYVWQGVSALILAAGALAAWRTRRKLGIAPIPLAVMVVGVLYNTPSLFVVERGQVDPLLIPPMILAAWLLGRRKAFAELAAGGLLGATAWLKYYPGLTLIVLIALGRRKATAAFLWVAALIGVVDFDGFRESVLNGSKVKTVMSGPAPYIHAMHHSIVQSWPLLWFVKKLPPLQQIPGVVVAAVLLLPAILLVCRKVARASDPSPLILPLFLWLTAVATFGLPYANDYNLITLPIAALAVWDRRDRLYVHDALGLSLIWSQPFWLPVPGEVLLLFKLGAVYAVGACLVARASGVSPTVESEDRAPIYRPALARVARPLEEATPTIGGLAPGSRSS
jgi:hypothetical protein